MPTVYNLDEFNCFVGESEALIDPRATAREGFPVYLLPAQATWTGPVGSVGINQVHRLGESGWYIDEDYRGQLVYQQDAPYAQDIMWVPGPIPAGWALTPPVYPEE